MTEMVNTKPKTWLNRDFFIIQMIENCTHQHKGALYKNQNKVYYSTRTGSELKILAFP